MKNISAIPHSELIQELQTLINWHYDAQSQHIHARWRFKNYAESCAFVMYVSLLTQHHDHHPDIHFGWGYAEIFLTTHDAHGITQRDLLLAREISEYAKK
jgi:4a-hydroxytetrahydrobiopterin dehydratase